ncbi:MAG: sulfatase-like hydrolase/transferase [Crocinitomicaceae bacterium]|nr:sulfatase-like hydrolase/transferase [Crocinitomicaceae bacterium]
MNWMIWSVVLVITSFFGCERDKIHEEFETENVVIIVVDGARYSESWGDPTHANVPNLDSLKSQGVFFPNFFNFGDTRTVPGHTALITGVYENLDNNGYDTPTNPSIFQCWAKKFNASSNESWVITSKDKLEVLGNCTRSAWRDQYLPETHCGVNGDGLMSGYQDDSATVAQGLAILEEYHPKLVLFNLREPDYSGHGGVWNQYLNAIQNSDEYVKQIIEFIQNDPAYQGKTTIFITCDHGRHTDGVAEGFSGHGDDCEGCQRIGMLAIGPDFKQGKTVKTEYGQIDIARTIARMLDFEMPHGKGRSIKELFR